MIAIDLGSNTIRFLAFDCEKKLFLEGYQKVVKTADGLSEFGCIQDATITRIIEAIDEAKKRIDFKNQTVIALTTEALRSASNAKEVLETIFVKTGIHFEIISGDKEAELTLLAVVSRLEKLALPSNDFVVVDIGGGSTEVTFKFQDDTFSKSFPIGIVTMAQSYHTLESIQEKLPLYMEEVKIFKERVYHKIQKPKYFIATAGTPTTVASMKLNLTYESYDASKINGTSLTKSELNFYLNRLLSYSFKQREKAVGTGRGDLVGAGILIYQALYDVLGFEECIVIDDGLREGIVLDGCKRIEREKKKV